MNESATKALLLNTAEKVLVLSNVFGDEFKQNSHFNTILFQLSNLLF